MTAWETIVHEHGPAVWRTAYRLLGNRSDADECMQDVFIAAVVVSRRGPVHNWPALLKKLAVLRGVDHLRRRARDVLRNDNGIRLSETVSRDVSPDVAAQDGELAEHLRWALAKLSSRQAEVACLRYLSEMTYEEISQKLQISVRHVGVVLSRAREKLRELLKERGADHG
ncbi:MAG: sigma-70 family RNA polymerase sigma factor [Planctomycetes bacterium]|nr:sigma-70 family RNA polymerase sigma factor [Planctomycetota bacterium]